MELDSYNTFCAALPSTTYVVQWNNSHVWKIGGKVFAIGNIAKDGLPAFIFKTSHRNFDFLSDYEGFRPAPYFASRGMKWIQCYGRFVDEKQQEKRDEELCYYLEASFHLVASGLSKKKQKALGVLKSTS